MRASGTLAFSRNDTCNHNIILLNTSSINRVTWHSGAIPEGEVWLKLGGDKGGGTFKLCFQHLNVPSPNSPDNTCIFTLFEAPDNYTNLSIAFERYKDALNDMETQTWRYNNNKSTS